MFHNIVKAIFNKDKKYRYEWWSLGERQSADGGGGVGK